MKMLVNVENTKLKMHVISYFEIVNFYQKIGKLCIFKFEFGKSERKNDIRILRNRKIFDISN